MKRIMLGACVVLSAAVYAAESAASFVFVNPDTTSFWRTARSRSVTVPVDFPEGATTATLSVTGVGYSASYEIASPGPYTFQLPEATSLGSENTYSLTLTFDRGAGKTARLSLITGQENGGAGSTRCLSQGSRGWPRVSGNRFTVPVPYGATSLEVDGTPVDTGLDGARGFFTVGAVPTDLELVVGATTNSVSIVEMPGSMLLIF